ncbi:MAG: hydrogenase small subunit [Xanthomonadaceae bacterium]|nr:hydrogenase small subunit [Xanthomonadaceae bacterium]
MSTQTTQPLAFDSPLGPDADQPIGRLGGMTRREMMKFCAGVAATMGLSQLAGVRMARAAESPKRPPVIWLHGQECTGCTESLLRAYHPTLETLLLDVISLDYHDTLCVGAGKQALDYKHKIMEEFRGQYILVTEGGTPMAEGGIYCKVGGKTQVELIREAAEGAAAIIAIGSCAAWGGVQSAAPNPTGAVGTHEVIPHKSVINVPGCPPNPYNFLSTVLHVLTFGEPPALDELNRPKFAYGRIIHENCERRPHFDAGRFALEFGDAGHRQGFCLYKIGCKGPETHANCPAIGFGDVGEGNWPVGIGAPCFGCTEKGVGFTKPIHSLANLTAQTPPSVYPSIDGARGEGASPGAAALVGGVVGVALGAGAMFVKRMAEDRDREQAAPKSEREREG